MMARGKIWVSIVLLFFLGCNKDSEIAFVVPLDYLPATPGSHWTYTNGERIMTGNSYVEHRYMLGTESSELSEVKKVPVYDSEYLYEYKITQASTQFPLKKLLEEKEGEAWQINLINGQKVMRQAVAFNDSFPITQLGTADTTWYTNVVEVVEFLDSAKAENWYLKEYYAKNVGLIRTDIDNVFDTLSAIIEKEIIDFYIN